MAFAALCAARDCASATKNGSGRSGAAGLDDVTGSDADGTEPGTGIGILEAGARRLGADAVAAAWTSTSFSLPFARERDPNQDEDEPRLDGGETETGNATKLVSGGLPAASGVGMSGVVMDVLSDSTSGITGISCGGRSLVTEGAGLEGPATGGETFMASILSRTFPVVPEISAPTTTHDNVGSVVRELRLSFLILKGLGGRQTLGRGDLVDAVLRMEAMEGWRERRGGLCCGLPSVEVSRALMRENRQTRAAHAAQSMAMR